MNHVVEKWNALQGWTLMYYGRLCWKQHANVFSNLSKSNHAEKHGLRMFKVNGMAEEKYTNAELISLFQPHGRRSPSKGWEHRWWMPMSVPPARWIYSTGWLINRKCSISWLNPWRRCHFDTSLHMHACTCTYDHQRKQIYKYIYWADRGRNPRIYTWIFGKWASNSFTRGKSSTKLAQ